MELLNKKPIYLGIQVKSRSEQLKSIRTKYVTLHMFEQFY
jgi:hypothetical protein